MYDILELNSKLVGELRDIAKKLNILKFEGLKKQELVYKILDQQAIKPAPVESVKQKLDKPQRVASVMLSLDPKEVRKMASQALENKVAEVVNPKEEPKANPIQKRTRKPSIEKLPEPQLPEVNSKIEEPVAPINQEHQPPRDRIKPFNRTNPASDKTTESTDEKPKRVHFDKRGENLANYAPQEGAIPSPANPSPAPHPANPSRHSNPSSGASQTPIQNTSQNQPQNQVQDQDLNILVKIQTLE